MDTRISKPIKVIVLAAGMGKRMRTEGNDLPKVMREANGRPLLAYVLDALDFIPPGDIVIVVGYGRDIVTRAFPAYSSAVQERQMGTGHAVQSAMETLADYEGDVLVCCGDMPLIKRETYKALVERHRSGDGQCTLLTGPSSDKLPYGRIIRGDDGEFLDIREDRDCSAEELLITELNSGVYVFDAGQLRWALGRLRSDNSQGEYYLTDVPKILASRGVRVDVCLRELGNEIVGVNTPEQLAEVEAALTAAGNS